MFYNILLTLPGLGGAPETARCYPNRVFYNIMIKFPEYWRSSRDRSMLSKTCILQYMINFPGYWRSFGDALELRGLKLELREALLMTASLIWNRSHPKPRASDQPCTLQYIIHVPGSRCYPSRVFYNIRFTLPGLGGAPETA